MARNKSLVPPAAAPNSSPAGPDISAQDTAEATAIMDASENAQATAAAAEDEFPDAFTEEDGDDRKAPF